VGIRYKRGAEQRVLNAESATARGSRRREAWGSWEGTPPPQLTRGFGERRELSQRGPGQSPGRQRILRIFQGLRNLLVETMHYGTNQNLGGGLGRIWGACAPLATA